MESTVLYRGEAQSPLGQIGEVVIQYGSKGIPTYRVLGGRYALVLLIDAQGTYSDANYKPRPVSSGDCFLLFPDLAHWYRPSAGKKWDEIYIRFKGPVFDLWRSTGLLTHQRPLFHLDPVADWTERFKSIAEVDESDPTARQLVMVMRFQTLLTDILRSQPHIALDQDPQHWVAKACQLLESDLASHRDSHWLAERVGMSDDAFRKQFAKATGMPPQHYRTAKRIHAAERLLSESDMNLKEIAATLGYYDEFAFSRRFKSVVGLSPTAYRQAVTPAESK